MKFSVSFFRLVTFCTHSLCYFLTVTNYYTGEISFILPIDGTTDRKSTGFAGWLVFRAPCKLKLADQTKNDFQAKYHTSLDSEFRGTTFEPIKFVWKFFFSFFWSSKTGFFHDWQPINNFWSRVSNISRLFATVFVTIEDMFSDRKNWSKITRLCRVLSLLYWQLVFWPAILPHLEIRAFAFRQVCYIIRFRIFCASQEPNLVT